MNLHAILGILTTVGQVLVAPIGLALGAWLARSLHTTAQHNAAALLTRIAQDAAALVVANNPNVPAAQLLEQVVTQISSASGLPTTNADAIRRAAAGALQTAQVPTALRTIANASSSPPAPAAAPAPSRQ